MAPTEKNNLRVLPPSSEICYFLGAGFSKASKYELPTGEGFLSRDARIYCRDKLNEKGTIPVSNHPDLHELLGRIEARYGDLESLNLESVMTDLYERTAGIGGPWSNRDVAYIDGVLPFKDAHFQAAAPEGIPMAPPPEGTDLQRDYKLLLLYVVLRLRIVEVREDECPMVRQFLNTLRLRDSIVTLNYDTMIERHWTVGAGERPLPDQRVDLLGYYIGLPTPGFHSNPRMLVDVQPKTRGYFTKLHGSVDWRSCPEPMCPNHRYIESTDRQRPDVVDGGEQWHCAACASVPETVIIPPVAAKPFERFPKLRLMWLQAFRALRLAPRWVFVGVSFADTDTHLRSLVRAASEEWFGVGVAGLGQICVVNKGCKSQEAADRLWECLAPRVQEKLRTEVGGIATFASVEDYLAAVESTDRSRAPDPAR
jgi:hypothetical protein